MKPDTAFLEAVLPEPVFLLNRSLRPFALTHQTSLQRFKSPLLLGGECCLQDLFFAVKVCSLNHRDGFEWVRLPWPAMEEEFAAWGKECGTDQFEPGDELPLVNTFLEYLLDGLNGPKPKPMERSTRRGAAGSAVGRKPGAPLDALMIWCLCGRLGMDFDTAMNFPLAAARWLYCTAMEQEGRLRLESQDAQTVAEAIRAYAKEHGLVPIRLTPEQMETLKMTGSVEIENSKPEEGK